MNLSTLNCKQLFFITFLKLKNMETTNFLNSLGSADLASFIKVLEAYNDQYETRRLEIESSGFNHSSGYVYLYLENSISIASCFGREVVYIVDNFKTGEEEFFNTYEEAENYLYNVEEEEEEEEFFNP